MQVERVEISKSSDSNCDRMDLKSSDSHCDRIMESSKSVDQDGIESHISGEGSTAVSHVIRPVSI